jgi:hypothetical protein
MVKRRMCNVLRLLTYKSSVPSVKSVVDSNDEYFEPCAVALVTGARIPNSTARCDCATAKHRPIVSPTTPPTLAREQIP